jgi:hypothetical protein
MGAPEPLLLNPLTEREVWLVLRNMVSAAKLEASLKSDDPPTETLQLNHLLQTTIAAIQSAGAKTRIFCEPYSFEGGAYLRNECR